MKAGCHYKKRGAFKILRKTEKVDIILAGILRSFEGPDNASKFCFPAQDERWVPGGVAGIGPHCRWGSYFGNDWHRHAGAYRMVPSRDVDTHYWNRSPFLLCLYPSVRNSTLSQNNSTNCYSSTTGIKYVKIEILDT